MSSSDVDDFVRAAAVEKREVQRDVRQALLSGVAITVPFLVTLLVLSWAFDAVANALGPLVDFLVWVGLANGQDQLLVEVVAGALVLSLVFAVGVMAQHGPNTTIGSRFDALMADLPGVGSIYTSVERMSDVIVDGDTESFREVKLVEFPKEGSYVLGFLTADAPAAIEDAAGVEELLTVFVPLAPNPVMGGHLVNLPPERVHDVDMSVEAGMQAIMTTGIAVDESTQEDDEEETGVAA